MIALMQGWFSSLSRIGGVSASARALAQSEASEARDHLVRSRDKVKNYSRICQGTMGGQVHLKCRKTQIT
jgi:hypothetical protein